MATLISDNKSVDLLSIHTFSMPANIDKIKQCDVGVKLPQRVGKTERVSTNNLPSTISLKEEPIMFQDAQFLYPIPPTAGYEICAQNENVCASSRLKADTSNSRRKRHRVFKSESQPSSYLKPANNQDLSYWLEKPRNDKDPNTSHVTADSQTLPESSISDLPSTKFAKTSNTVFLNESVLPVPAGSTCEAQGSYLGLSDRSKQPTPIHTMKEDCEIMKNKKRKMLELNNMGKLGPLPSEVLMESTELSKRMGKHSTPAKFLVVLKYGREEDTRRKFAEIVDKNLQVCTSMSKPEFNDDEVGTVKRAKSDKSVHPFFTSRQKAKANADAQGNHEGLVKHSIHRKDEFQFRKCAVTPGKLRAQRQNCVEANWRIANSTSLPTTSARNSTKLGGNCYSWPSKANLHVRGIENAASEVPSPRDKDSNTFRENRKLKGNLVTISHSDNTIRRLSEDLCFHTDLDRTATLQNHASWRAPTREVTTGPDLVNWFSREIFTSRHAMSPRTQQHGDTIDNERITMHPALERLYNETVNTLTPFDEFVCESMLWASKYSPRTADQVLQSDDQAKVLRNWLRSLSLHVTQNRMNLDITSNSTVDRNSVLRRTRLKKRKKANRLEGFVASSDEESNNGEELSKIAPDNYSAILQKGGAESSLVTGGCDNLSNAVLISGPHGCGKTAAVYAVAEELGFEVFEINPGTRRTGRDLLDKVGEMAENHLVQPAMDPLVSNKLDGLGMAELFAAKNDTISQRSMKSFFETKSQPTISKKKVEENQRASLCRGNEKLERTKPRQQKQSLILLEEADILFDKDKQFWPTVMSLLTYSKRPVVMTCTDERLIPQDLIKFQANLQFSLPPRDTTIDYLMLLAGREGHKLSRDAISSIFDQTNHDLRACIMTLNFWCQMAVGDPKGGLDWMINRWPAGIDLDRFGRKLRVVSNETYRKGMALMPSDLCFAKESVVYDRECEILRDAYNDRRVDLELLYDTLEKSRTGRNSVSQQCLLQESRTTYQQLTDAQILSDTWSFADCFMKEQLDPTKSFIPDRTRADTPEGVSILSTEPVENYARFTNHLAITSILLSRQLRPENNDAASGSIDSPICAAAKAAQNRCQEISEANNGSSLTSAFGPLAPDSSAYSVLTSHTQGVLASEVAPYVRAISAHDQAIEIQRASRLASFGGRLTRAARSVVEGVERGRVRRDKWIPGLNFDDISKSAGRSWRQNYILSGGHGEKEEEKENQIFVGDRAIDPR